MGLTKDFFNKIYDILVGYGAMEKDRDCFVDHFYSSRDNVLEYRFMGIFGFGGKFWMNHCYSRIYCSYYSEHHTPQLDEQLKELNQKLKELWKQS